MSIEYVITHQFTDVNLSEDELKNMLEIVSWKQTPWFAAPGRTAWHSFEDEQILSHESLQYLEEAVSELYQELKTINPSLQFMLLPFSINPIPETPQEQNLRKLDLIRTEDVTILGSTWTASADTRYLSYEEVSDWQLRLLQVGESGYSSEVNLKVTTTSKSNPKDKAPQASVLH